MTIDLSCAWEFTCPDCGTNHFVRAAVVDVPDEDLREIAFREGLLETWQDDAPLPPELEGEWVSKPDYVTCPDCSREFEVHQPSPDTESF